MMGRIVIELPEWFTHEGVRNLLSPSTVRCADRIEVTARDGDDMTVRVWRDRFEGPS